MARHESEKEDLIAEAIALVDRAEYSHTHPTAADDELVEDQLVTVGFRDNGSFSIYFAQVPFYQFDADYALRRAYEGGFLFRSQGDTLAKLKRERSDQQTALIRNDLNSTELSAFFDRMIEQLTSFQTSLCNGSATLLRSVTKLPQIDRSIVEFIDNVLKSKPPLLSAPINKRK